MNILIMANYRTPCSGNFIASVLELAERVRREGGCVHFLFPEPRGGGRYHWTQWLEENGFSVTLLKERLAEDEVLPVLRRLIRKHGIEIIHTHFGLYHNLLVRHASKLGVKVLIHDHMDFSPEDHIHRQKMHVILFSAVYRLKGIHVVSVMELKRKYYLLCRRSNCHYVPNGLSLRRNIPAEVTRDQRRAMLGIADDQKLCLFLGWDMYRKGVDIAVKAAAALRRQDPGVHLGLVGFSDTPSEKSLQWIRERTGIEPVCEWIHFLPSTEDMFSYHRAADVYLSASRKEAFSYGILEAVSQNTPVVVSDIEGTRWAMQYSKAVSYPVEDAHACAAAMARALEMGRMESNRREIMARYSMDDWCASIIGIYRRMLAE